MRIVNALNARIITTVHNARSTLYSQVIPVFRCQFLRYYTVIPVKRLHYRFRPVKSHAFGMRLNALQASFISRARAHRFRSHAFVPRTAVFTFYARNWGNVCYHYTATQYIASFPTISWLQSRDHKPLFSACCTSLVE